MSKHRITMNPAASLLLPVLLLISLVAGCSAPLEQELFDDARNRFARGDEYGAMIQLKNLLRANPNNLQARLLRGEVALSLEDGVTAEADLLKAEELGAERADIVANLGQAIMLQAAHVRIIAEIHTGSAADDQTYIAISLLRGNAYLWLGKFENAATAFLDVLAIDSSSPDARIGLGRVALAQDEIGEALTEMARAVSLGSDLPQVWIANGEAQLFTDDPKAAKESFQRAIALRPVERLRRDDYAALNGLFQSHLALGEIDEAKAIADKAMQVSSGHPLAYYLQGQHAKHAGDLETAKTYLLKTLAVLPRHLGALSLMGSISLEEGKLEQADIYLRQALALDRQNPRIRMQLAQTLMQLDEGNDALDVLAPVMRKLGDMPELLALAGRATAASRSRTGWLAYFEQAAASDPSDLRWQFELAQAYIAAGKADKAMDILERIPDSAETTERRDLIMIGALRRARKLDTALELANKLVARNPSDAGMQLMVGQLHLANSNLNEARSHLNAVLDESHDSIPALLTLGQVEIRSGNLDEAEGLFREAYNKQPDYLPTVTLLVSLAQSRGRTDAAIKWLEAARETNPVAIMPRVGLVSLYLLQDKVSSAYELAREAIELEPNDSRALAALGMTQIRREEYRLAIQTLEKASVVAPKSGMIRFQLAQAYHGINHSSDARRSLKKAIELSPWRANYAIAAAKLELSLDNPKGAEEIARQLIGAHADDPSGYNLLGESLMRQDRHEEAAEIFASAVVTGQHERYVLQQYDALVQAGDKNAHRVLAHWVDDKPDAWRVRAMLAQSHHVRGETALAIEQYERVLKDQPENAAVLNNLAWLYLDVDSLRALKLAELVHKQEPYVGTYTDTLGWMLVLQGNLDRGLALLRTAARQDPNNEEIQYHLAAALAKIGEVDKARLLLTELINSGKSFDSEMEARSLLQTL